MYILLTNDDGIHAKGLTALHKELKKKHRIIVVAPETEQSAVGHSITLADPIKVKEIHDKQGFYGYAVGGTPADCVQLAMAELLDEKPDIVISGINLGANVGLNLLYSGTVSAATEAAIWGYPAIAVSLDTFKDPDFSYAAKFIRRLIGKMDKLAMAPHVSLNVNIPAVKPEEIKGVVWTKQCRTGFVEKFTKRRDPRGNVYYWQHGEKPPRGISRENDWGMLHKNMVTITPISYDLTHHTELDRLINLDIKI